MLLLHVASALSLALGACLEGTANECSLPNCEAAVQYCTAAGSFGTCRCVIESCDDGNQCTQDGAAGDPDAGFYCVNTVRTGQSCSDGNPCTTGETCRADKTCQGGSPIPASAYDDGNRCTTDSCSPASGVVHTPVAAGTPCGDDNVCNGRAEDETCDGAGVCRDPPDLLIDDADVCTVDRCDPETGVRHDVVASCGDPAGASPSVAPDPLAQEVPEAPNFGGPVVVEHTGEATYTYPFSLPKARGRYQPTLALTYGSARDRNVGYGHGWSLTTSFVEHDPALGPNHYWLTLDGATSALVSVGPNKYRPDVMSAFVEATYEPGTIPRWTVVDAVGTTYRFDFYRAAPSDQGSRWYLGSITDVDGNVTTYSYLPEGSEGPSALLSGISYNGSNHSVALTYTEMLPDRFDRVAATVVRRSQMLTGVTTYAGSRPILSYAPHYGLATTRTLVLETVEVIGSDGPYGPSIPPTRFTYETEGGGDYVLSAGQSFDPPNLPDTTTNPSELRWIDLDGDSRLDVAFDKAVPDSTTGERQLYWARNVSEPGGRQLALEATVVVPTSRWEGTGLARMDTETSVRQVLLATVRDMNADGVPDLVWAQGTAGCEILVRHGSASAGTVTYGGAQCYGRSNGTNELAVRWNEVTGGKPFGLEYVASGNVLVSLMDIDGDRGLDYVFFKDAGWRVFPAAGRLFDAETTRTGTSNFGSADYCPFIELPSGPFYDLNGDGYPDSARRGSDSDCNGVGDGVDLSVFFGQGLIQGAESEWYWWNYDPFRPDAPWTQVAWPQPPEAPVTYSCSDTCGRESLYEINDLRATSDWVDLNGDGRVDYVYKTQDCATAPCPLIVYWNTGGGFVSGQVIEVPANIYPRARPGPMDVMCYCGIDRDTGEQILVSGSTSMTNYYAEFVDANADGVADHVSSAGGAWRFYPGSFGSPGGAVRLRTVTTPTGARYALSYAPAARYGEAPQYSAPHVVTSSTLTGPRMPQSQTTYAYADPAVGRARYGVQEPRGFERTWVTDATTGIVRATTWAVDSYVFTGSPLTIEWSTASGEPFKTVSYGYAGKRYSAECYGVNVEPTNYPVMPVTTSTRIAHHVDWVTLSSSRSKGCADVDDYGNELKVWVDPDESVRGDEIYESSSYDRNAACKSCKVTQKRTTDVAGNDILSELVYRYDSPAGTWNQPLPPNSAGKGHLNYVTAWVYNPVTGLGGYQDAAERIAYNSNGTIAKRVRPAASPLETDVTESYTYDPTGVNVTQVRTSGGTPSGTRTLITNTQYDFAGRPTVVVGPFVEGANGPATTKAFRYDHFGRVTAVGRSVDGANLVDAISATVYLPALFTEDESGANEGGATKQYTFSVPVTLSPGQSLPDGPDARISTIYLDGLGRAVQVRERLGTNSTTSAGAQVVQSASGYRVTGATRYDAAGRITAMLEPFFSATDAYEPFEVVSAAAGARGTMTRFDDRGRVTCSAGGVFAAVSTDLSCTSSLQGTSYRLSTAYWYRGFSRDGSFYMGVEAVPPAAAPIRGMEAVYAASGLLKRTTDAYGNEIVRDYDRVGRLASVTRVGYGNVGAQTYTKYYDTLGRVVAEHDPNWSPGRSSPSRVYQYDAQSRLVKLQLAEKRVGTEWVRPELNYEYASLGRRTRVYAREPILVGSSITFVERDIANISYDEPLAGDGPQYPYTAGAVSWVASPLSTIAFGYTRDGAVARRDQWFQGIAGAFSASSTWGNDGRLLSSTFESPYSKPVTFTGGFDTAGRPVRLELAGTAVWEAVQVDPYYGAFDAVGRLAHVRSNGGLVDTYRTYDPHTQDLVSHVVSASGTQVYGIDRIVYFGTKLQSFVDDATGTEYAYRYDSNARLTRATATSTGSLPLAQSFDDAFSFADAQWQPNATVGNLEAVTSRAPDGSQTTSTYDYVDDRVTSVKGGAISSSAAYEYDVENRLRRVVRGGVVAEQLEYDSSGALLARVSADQVSYFVGALATIALPTSCQAYGCTVDPASIRVTVHAALGGTRIASVRAPPAGSPDAVDTDVLYYHRDRQGSVIATTLTGGRVGYRYRYDAYGLEMSTPPPLATTGDARSELGYTGGLKLSGDLLHLKARVYDARLKRFLQADSTDLYRYSYVAGDPANLTDPSGMMPIEGNYGRTSGLGASPSIPLIFAWGGSLVGWGGVLDRGMRDYEQFSAIDRVTAEWFGASYLPQNRARLDAAWRAEVTAKNEAEKARPPGLSRPGGSQGPDLVDAEASPVKVNTRSRGYATEEEAVKAASDEINDFGIAQNREFGYWIVKDGNVYHFTEFIPGSEGNVDLGPYEPQGAVAWGHTHGAWNGDPRVNYFSGEDAEASEWYQATQGRYVNGYVTGPNGQMWRYDPKLNRAFPVAGRERPQHYYP